MRTMRLLGLLALSSLIYLLIGSDAETKEYEYPELPEKLTLGICQINLLKGDGPNGDANIQRNIDEMSKLVDEAVAKGAEVVVLPEYWAFGYVDKETLHKIAEPVPTGRLCSFMIDKAKQHGVYLIGGTVIEKGEGDKIYNTNIFIDPKGNILSKHRKAHLYTPLGEDLVFSAGNRFTVTKTPWGNVGIMICYDGDFPEVPRLLKLMGAHIIFELAAYETPCESWWKHLYKAHAMTNAVWLVQACEVGDCMDDKVHLFGMSRVLAPNGDVVAEATYYPPKTPPEDLKSEVLVTTINLREGLEKGRNEFQCLTKDRRPDLYSPLTNPSWFCLNE